MCVQVTKMQSQLFLTTIYVKVVNCRENLALIANTKIWHMKSLKKFEKQM